MATSATCKLDTDHRPSALSTKGELLRRARLVLNSLASLPRSNFGVRLVPLFRPAEQGVENVEAYFPYDARASLG
jgi:hypothetical protein